MITEIKAPSALLPVDHLNAMPPLVPILAFDTFHKKLFILVLLYNSKF